MNEFTTSKTMPQFSPTSPTLLINRLFTQCIPILSLLFISLTITILVFKQLHLYRYYQWVCFALFFQAIVFYVPRFAVAVSFVLYQIHP